jgi:hypothetical protein
MDYPAVRNPCVPLTSTDITTYEVAQTLPFGHSPRMHAAMSSYPVFDISLTPAVSRTSGRSEAAAHISPHPGH